MQAGILAVSIALMSSTSASEILGAANQFAVLGASTVTSTGPTILFGDLGVYPGSAITGFLPGIVFGTTHLTDLVAQQAHTDSIAAFSALGTGIPIANLTGINLGGLTLGPGVRNFASSAQLTGILTLDAGGNSNARFDFLIGSTLVSDTGSVVHLINGARADNVFWQVGSSATLGVETTFAGTILADQSITLNTGADLLGRALAIHGAVTLDSNTITVPVPEAKAFLPLALLLPGLGIWKFLAVRRRGALV